MTALRARSIAPNVWRGSSTCLLRAGVVMNHEKGSARVDLDGDLCAVSASLMADVRAGLHAQGVRTVSIELSNLRLCTTPVTAQPSSRGGVRI